MLDGGWSDGSTVPAAVAAAATAMQRGVKTANQSGVEVAEMAEQQIKQTKTKHRTQKQTLLELQEGAVD